MRILKNVLLVGLAFLFLYLINPWCDYNKHAKDSL